MGGCRLVCGSGAEGETCRNGNKVAVVNARMAIPRERRENDRDGGKNSRGLAHTTRMTPAPVRTKEARTTIATPFVLHSTPGATRPLCTLPAWPKRSCPATLPAIITGAHGRRGKKPDRNMFLIYSIGDDAADISSEKSLTGTPAQKRRAGAISRRERESRARLVGFKSMSGAHIKMERPIHCKTPHPQKP